jgi:hypothetical protein
VKGCEKKQWKPNLKHYSGIPEGLRKPRKKCHDIHQTEHYLNPGPAGNETEVPLLRHPFDKQRKKRKDGEE